MRRQLVAVFASVALLVAVAFVVPLGLLVRTVAQDQALDRARADAAALAPVLAVTTDRSSVESAISATPSGRSGLISVFFQDGSVLGSPAEVDEVVRRALLEGRSITVAGTGDVRVLSAVVFGAGEPAIIQVRVPGTRFERGLFEAWLVLGAVGLFLVGVAVMVADRLARTIVEPVAALSRAAAGMGGGDLSVRVTPSGPAELTEVGGAFNLLASQVAAQLDRERELVADLAHRLRTPLTRLRLDVDSLSDREAATGLHADLDDVDVTVDRLIREARRRVGHDGPESCDAKVVVGDRLEFWSTLAEDQGRPWELTGSHDSAIVPVWRADLAAALDVLIDNVFSHTPDGAGFQVMVTNSPGEVTVSVIDQGPGLGNGDLLERGRSSAGSTGLGLDIARRTAEDAGGHMTVKQMPGGGTAFALIFPTM